MRKLINLKGRKSTKLNKFKENIVTKLYQTDVFAKKIKLKSIFVIF